MPSLRRTASSPLVRTSPYSYSSSLAGAQEVLADIEWWKVTDGQCESSSVDFDGERLTNDDDENNVASDTIASPALLNVDTGVDRLLMPSALWASDDVRINPSLKSEASSDVPTAEFAALSLAPRTPPTRRPRRGRQSTSSSLESTPEPPVLIIEGLHLGLSDMGMFDDHVSFVSFEPAALPSPPRLTRAHTFADIFSGRRVLVLLFGISPSQPPFLAHLRQLNRVRGLGSIGVGSLGQYHHFAPCPPAHPNKL
ncbi:hypothetical protein BKA70DRAFT_1426860 [Coprinopsis sp. MPI-PUGE-AT-0042]|nr:hypothetical protein BKA70DRAFT_1426860 [Coprinopsis sp. MPI-PUGE-AT-0042]